MTISIASAREQAVVSKIRRSPLFPSKASFLKNIPFFCGYLSGVHNLAKSVWVPVSYVHACTDTLTITKKDSQHAKEINID